MATKVKRSGVPLLVVGLGGTGKDVALAIKRKFQERFENLDPNTLMPPETAFLILDDDVTGVSNDPSGIMGADYARIHVEGMAQIFHNQNFSAYERSWINTALTPSAAEDGAGGVRQIGRLQLFRNVDTVVDRLTKKLNGILADMPSTPKTASTFNVLICSSLSGGTGSGTSLDMAYIVRQAVAQSHGAYADSMKIYGLFVMPQDILLKPGYKHNSLRDQELQANAFAAMKEIDYWMRQEQHGQQLTVKYSAAFKANWNQRPFNYLGYIGHTWENGQAIVSPYEEAIRKITELALLLSAETPQATGDRLIEHSIYSNLCNADKTVLSLQGQAPYPVSVYGLSLGTSEYSSDAMGISNYEQEKTLNLVLDVPTFNVKTGEPMSREDAQLTGSEIVEGVLGLEKPQDGFFDTLRIGTNDPRQYMDGKVSGLNDNFDFSKAGLTAARESYAGQIKEYFIKLLPEAQDFQKEYFAKLWSNFVNESKRYIRDIQCGPVGYLRFLKEVYIPDLDATEQNCKDDIKNLPNVIGLCTENCGNSYTQAIGFHPLQGEAYLNAYSDACDNLIGNCAAECTSRARQQPLHDYRMRVENYVRNLELLVNELRRAMDSCTHKKVDLELMGGDLSFEQLRAYLDDNLTDQAHAQSVAAARDRVLEELADTGFEMPLVDTAHSNAEREALKARLADRIGGFVRNAFEAVQMDNLDVILRAAGKEKKEDPVGYMADEVAPRMERASLPMLWLKSAPGVKPSYYDFWHTSVPREAKEIQAGLDRYNNDGVAGEIKKGDYTVSDMSDRMLHLRMRLGIPMYMMQDTYALRKEYEEVLNRPASDPCRGIHLVHTVPSFNGLKEGQRYSVAQTWLKLPSPIPPTEIGESDLSKAEKNTQQYLEDLFTKAVDSGIIVFDTAGGTEPYDPMKTADDGAVLSNEVFRVCTLSIDGDADAMGKLHVEDIKRKIDAVYEDESRTAKSRLEQLRAMHRKNMQQAPLGYGTYMGNYANALHQTPILPTVSASPTEREKTAERYISVRHQLCAWMLSMYPEYLCLVEKNLTAFEYLHEKEAALEAVVAHENRMYDLAEKFCVPLAAGQVGWTVPSFWINNQGAHMDLFDCDFDRYDKRDLVYWDALFLMEYEEHAQTFNDNTKDLIRERLDHYPADFKTLRNKGLLRMEGDDELGQPLYAFKSETENKLKTLRADMSMDYLRRETMMQIYQKLLDTLAPVLKAYELARDNAVPTEPAKPAPVPAEPVSPQPVVPALWNCACGRTGIDGNFCPNCGTKRPC